MSNKSGFSLLSFLLYLFLFSLISLFICQMISSLLLPLLTETRTCQALVRLHIASDLFVRDIKQAKNEKDQWKLISPNTLVWSTDNDDIGWSIEDNKLKRRMGQYKKGWRKQNICIVAEGLFDGAFVPEMHDNTIIGVEMTLSSSFNKEKAIICYAAVEGKK